MLSKIASMACIKSACSTLLSFSIGGLPLQRLIIATIVVLSRTLLSSGKKISTLSNTMREASHFQPFFLALSCIVNFKLNLHILRDICIPSTKSLRSLSDK